MSYSFVAKNECIIVVIYEKQHNLNEEFDPFSLERLQHSLTLLEDGGILAYLEKYIRSSAIGSKYHAEKNPKDGVTKSPGLLPRRLISRTTSSDNIRGDDGSLDSKITVQVNPFHDIEGQAYVYHFCVRDSLRSLVMTREIITNADWYTIVFKNIFMTYSKIKRILESQFREDNHTDKKTKEETKKHPEHINGTRASFVEYGVLLEFPKQKLEGRKEDLSLWVVGRAYQENLVLLCLDCDFPESVLELCFKIALSVNV